MALEEFSKFSSHSSKHSAFFPKGKRFQCKCMIFNFEPFFSLAVMISEGYCDQNHHCQGGALCKGKLCICPPGYFPGAGNTKCIKAGGRFVPFQLQCLKQVIKLTK